MHRSLLIPAFAALLLIGTVAVGRTGDHSTSVAANVAVAVPAPTSPRTLPPATPSPQPATPTPQPTPVELFFVRPTGPQGELIAYNQTARQAAWRLPPGMPSANWKHYYAASRANGSTIVAHFDLSTGMRTDDFTVPGRWALSGVAYQGQWLTLTRIVTPDEQQAWTRDKRWQTDVQVVAASSGRVVHTLQLDGNFDVETIAGSGDALFLIQHLPALNPDHYLIRLYDLAHDTLQVDPLRAKGPDEFMAGLAWDGIASPDGRWLLTLYLSTKRDTAFVHTLDLVNKQPVCIDLPSDTSNFSNLKNYTYYTLALAPHAQTLYAANAALGVVAEISLERREVVRTVKFPPHPTPAYDSGIPESHSVLSKDGRMLYFTNGHGVWAYSTTNGAVRQLSVSTVRITDIGVSGDGQQVLLARTDEVLLVLDTTAQTYAHP